METNSSVISLLVMPRTTIGFFICVSCSEHVTQRSALQTGGWSFLNCYEIRECQPHNPFRRKPTQDGVFVCNKIIYWICDRGWVRSLFVIYSADFQGCSRGEEVRYKNLCIFLTRGSYMHLICPRHWSIATPNMIVGLLYRIRANKWMWSMVADVNLKSRKPCSCVVLPETLLSSLFTIRYRYITVYMQQEKASQV